MLFKFVDLQKFSFFFVSNCHIFKNRNFLKASKPKWIDFAASSFACGKMSGDAEQNFTCAGIEEKASGLRFLLELNCPNALEAWSFLQHSLTS